MRKTTVQPESLCFRADLMIKYLNQKTALQEAIGMDNKKLIPAISMVSVGVMVVWGLLANDWSKSWIAVMIGGIAIAVLSIVNKK